MSSDVENLRIGVQDVLFVSVVQLGQMLVAALCMLWADWLLFLLVLGLAPILYVLNRLFHARLSVALREVQESFSRVVATLAESVQGIRVTQGFVRQEANAEMFGDLAADHSRYNLKVAYAQGLFVPLLDLNSQVFVATLLVLGGLQVCAFHAAQVGDLVTFFFMANLFFSPISALGNQYHQALTAMAGAERVFRLLDRAPERQDSTAVGAMRRLEGGVEFRNLSFGYSPDRLVLRNLQLRVPPGRTVALVGPTGSGKTSIINLIAKFYLPTSGSLLIDGTNILDIDTDSLHRQIGIVLQENFLFSGSVMDNIRVGRPSASDGEVAQTGVAARMRRPVGLAAPRTADRSRRTRSEFVARPKATRLFRPRPVGEPANPDPRRGDQQRGSPHGSQDPVVLASFASGPHELRHCPPPEHDSLCRPRRSPGPGADRRTRQARRVAGPRGRLRPIVPFVCTSRGGIAARLPDAPERQRLKELASNRGSLTHVPDVGPDSELGQNVPSEGDLPHGDVSGDELPQAKHQTHGELSHAHQSGCRLAKSEEQSNGQLPDGEQTHGCVSEGNHADR